MKRHRLKTLPEFFDAVLSGVKTFEVRRDDRDFQVGDILCLEEYDPSIDPLEPESPRRTTGRTCDCRVTYILTGPLWGVSEGCVAMAIVLA